MGKITTNPMNALRNQFNRPKNAKEANIIKEKAIEIAADTMQKEFEAYFADELERAYDKLQEVTEALGDLMNTVLLQDNRLYLYEILMDNTTEEIVTEIKSLIDGVKDEITNN